MLKVAGSQVEYLANMIEECSGLYFSYDIHLIQLHKLIRIYVFVFRLGQNRTVTESREYRHL